MRARLLASVLFSLFIQLPFAQSTISAERYRWHNVRIGGGGFVPGIVFSPAEPGLMYCRTDIGGAYRWDSAVKRWVPLNDSLGWSDWNLLGIESIGVDPHDPNRVYLAAGTYTQSWAGNGAILRSSDRGQTWARTDLPFKMGGNEDGRSIGERLVVDPSQTATLYFGSRTSGLWRSSDYAASWTKVSSFPTTTLTNALGIGFIVFDPRDSVPGQPCLTIYAGCSGSVGLYRSTDAGATWAPVAGQPEGLIPHHAVLDNAGILYLTYSNGPGPNGVTAGAVWKLNTSTGIWSNITPPVTGSFGWAGLTLDQANPGTLAVSTLDRWWPGDDIYRSTDGGSNWGPLGARSVRDVSGAPYLKWGGTSAALGHWIGDLEIDPFNPDHALYVTGATIWETEDLRAVDAGQTSHWYVGANGIEETAVQDLVSPPQGAHLLSALGDLGGFRHDALDSTPADGMFANPILTTGTSLDFAEKNPDVVARVGYVGNNLKHGTYSQDGGSTWTPFPTEPAGSHEAGTIAVSSEGTALVWTPKNNSSFYSGDLGASWSPCGGLPAGSLVVSDRVNPSRFYALDPTGTLWGSTDGGRTFVWLRHKWAAGSRLRATPGYEGDLWITSGTGGLHSYMGKTTGSTPGPAFTVGRVEEAHALGFGAPMPGFASPAVYLVGKVEGIRGVFRYNRDTGNWTRINDDSHQYGWIGQVITGDPRVPGRVYLGTNGRGILYADPVVRARGTSRRRRQ